LGEKFFYLSNSHWLSIQDSLAVACCKKRLRKGKLNNWVMKINWIYALLRKKWWRIICPWEKRSEIKYIVLPSREIKLRCISINLESILPSHQKPKWLLLFVKKQFKYVSGSFPQGTNYWSALLPAYNAYHTGHD
jgi:hypothetical protein